MSKLGPFIKKTREAAKQSKAAFAKAVGVAWTTANDWEEHGVVPRPGHLAKVADVLKLSADARAQLYNMASEASGEQLTSEEQDNIVMRADFSPEPVEQQLETATHRSEIERLLGRCMNHREQLIGDAMRVLTILEDDAPRKLFRLETGRPETVARALLEGAARLRRIGVPVTAETLLIAACDALAARLPQGHGEELGPDAFGDVEFTYEDGSPAG